MLKSAKTIITISANGITYGIDTRKSGERKHTIQPTMHKSFYGKCNYTDTCIVVLDANARKLAYKALAKIYARSASDKIRIMADDIIRMSNGEQIDSDANDIIQIVFEALLQLVNIGLVNSASDIFEYRHYVYKVVNKYVYESRRNASELVQADADSDADSDADIDKPMTETGYTDIEDRTLIDSISAWLEANLDSRCNKQNIIATFEAIVFYGFTEAQISSTLKVDKACVHRYLDKAKNCIRARGHQFAQYVLYDTSEFMRIQANTVDDRKQFLPYYIREKIEA